MTPLQQKTIEFASAAVGVREEPLGSNDGPAVRKYLASVGINEPAFWCAAFVNYQIKNAATHMGLISDWPATGSCQAIHDWAVHHGRLLASPVPGCVFLVPEGGVYHHCGLVVSVEGAVLHTIEGNTNDNGSSNGIGVFARTRNSHGLAFVRI